MVVAGATPEPLDPELRRRVDVWLAVDPDPVTRAELHQLLAAGAGDELAERFSAPLRFGTAGVRAELGAGPQRMNRVVAARLARGLVTLLAAHDRAGDPVVVGHDARWGSAELAEQVASALLAAGHPPLRLPRALPTPVLAFAVGHLGAAAGVMVTASHNPPNDNGLKVYLDDGAQVVPPADGVIAAALADEAPVPAASPDDPRLAPLDDAVVAAYRRHLTDVAGRHPVPPAGALSVVYTPLHGVGAELAVEALHTAGVAELTVVADQADPDPAFPTVPYPNPEEAGVLARAVADAQRSGASLVLANDPDADRLAVAVPAPNGSPGSGSVVAGPGWRRLTGDELGVLLAEHLLAAGSGPDRLVVGTYVSTRLLARVAAHHGVHYVETPTGFKWIVRPALAHTEWRFVLGYEEALGYAVDDVVRDKDGLSAAVVAASLVGSLAAGGRTVWDQLDELARRHGLHATRGWFHRWSGPGSHRRVTEAVERFRTRPPVELGGRAVVRAVDLRREAPLAGLDRPDAVVFELEGEARVVVRPSGTEPKVKAYLEVVTPVAAGDVAAARRAADAGLDRLAASLDEHLAG